jgi:L-galactono-1,4-lactone dehydrogenase
VVAALRPHGLTLQNYASIDEQQMGGFVQVGAHGTGATVPPVDEQVVGMKMVTPALGTLTLTPDGDNADLFYLSRVGLGALGVVSELTLQCVPAHELREHTYVPFVLFPLAQPSASSE